MLGGYTPENSALTTAGNFKSMESKFNYCHKPRHTHESCWKPHVKGGKLVIRSGRANQAATVDVSHENLSPTQQEPILLSKEHKAENTSQPA
ncbi:hypothetical protein AAG906_017097 [Vitis piasezkii]